MTSITRDVEDMRRLQRVAFVPQLFALCFWIGVPVCVFTDGPWLWCLGLAASFTWLGRAMAQGSALASGVFSLVGTAGLVAGALPMLSTRDDATLMGLALLSIPMGMSWYALPGALRLRQSKPHRAPASPGRSSWPTLAEIDRRSLVKAARPAAACAMYGVLAVYGLIFGFAIGRGLVGGPFMRFFTRRANRSYRKLLQILAQRACEVRAKDQRAPVLFLRSFTDDELDLKRRGGLLRGVVQAIRTLEELVVERVWNVGPVIAVGKPGTELSPLGAPREFVEGPNWQALVQSRLSETSLVVAVLGASDGLLWEYGRVSLAERPLLLVTPKCDRPVFEQRWRAFLEAYPRGRAITLPDDGDLPLLTWFPCSGGEGVITCKHQDELSYEMAFDRLLAAHAPGVILSP